MDERIEKVGAYRDRARRMRDLAKNERTPSLRQKLEDISAEYDRLAESFLPKR